MPKTTVAYFYSKSESNSSIPSNFFSYCQFFFFNWMKICCITLSAVFHYCILHSLLFVVVFACAEISLQQQYTNDEQSKFHTHSDVNFFASQQHGSNKKKTMKFNRLYKYTLCICVYWCQFSSVCWWCATHFMPLSQVKFLPFRSSFL